MNVCMYVINCNFYVSGRVLPVHVSSIKSTRIKIELHVTCMYMYGKMYLR